MDFKEFYDVRELLCSDKIDDFRHIELFTKDLANRNDYNHTEFIDKVKDCKYAMQRLGFICEIALEYAQSIKKQNPELSNMYDLLNQWREGTTLNDQVFFMKTSHSFERLLAETSNPKARKWNVVSDYSSGDLAKLKNFINKIN